MKAVLCGCFLYSSGMAYTAVGVAINGIVNRLSTDSNEKMKIISIANVASNVLQTVLAAVAMPMILIFQQIRYGERKRIFMDNSHPCTCFCFRLFLICGFKCKVN